MLILAHGYLLVILWWSLYVDSLLFCKSWHIDGYNCLNACLYALWSTLVLILMHSISFFSRIVFDKFIVKGGEYGHKVGRTLANRVDETRNMINDYLRGRTCIESVRGSWFQGGVDFELLLWPWAFLTVLSFSYLLFVILLDFAAFVDSCGFSSSRWPFWAFHWLLVF
jgi:hypothetical protein